MDALHYGLGVAATVVLTLLILTPLLVGALRPGAWPLAVGLLVSLGLALTQARELAWIAVERAAAGSLWSVVAQWSLAILFGVLVHTNFRVLAATQRAPAIGLVRARGPRGRAFERALVKWLPRACAALPLLILGAVSLGADPGPTGGWRWAVGGAYLLSASAILLIVPQDRFRAALTPGLGRTARERDLCYEPRHAEPFGAGHFAMLFRPAILVAGVSALFLFVPALRLNGGALTFVLLFGCLLNSGVSTLIGLARWWAPVGVRRLTLGGVTVFALTLAGTFAWFGWSNNHALRLVDVGAEKPDGSGPVLGPIVGRPRIEEHFRLWLTDNGGPSAAEAEPLIVAAAQGGGLRAAFWTAAALATLRERDPKFDRHLFAVVGVSGGALGAVVYRGLLDVPDAALGRAHLGAYADAEGCNARCRAAAAILAHDFLSPWAAGALFSDLPVHLLPPLRHLPFISERQADLEWGWEEAWRRTLGCSDCPQLDLPFMEFAPLRTDRPALLLVAADVAAGRRWITTNLRLDTQQAVDAVDLLAGAPLPFTCGWEPKKYDGSAGLPPFTLAAGDYHPGYFLPVRASTAAGLSARFPYVSPAATVPSGRDTTVAHAWCPSARASAAARHREAGRRVPEPRLLDGGLFEGTGVQTAGEVLRAVGQYCTPTGTGRPDAPHVFECRDSEGGTKYVRPLALVLTNAPNLCPDVAPAGEEGFGTLPISFPELVDPITALFNSRQAHSAYAVHRLRADPFLFAGNSGGVATFEVIMGDPAKREGDIAPLSWSLSGATNGRMLKALNDGTRYGAEPVGRWLRGKAAYESCFDREPAAAAPPTVAADAAAPAAGR